MKATIDQIAAGESAWVSVCSVASVRDTLELGIVVRQGKRGRILGRWTIHCLGVREASLSDFDGGGLRRYASTHPVARQYSDARATIRLSDVTDPTRILGVLMQAHVLAVDDWIQFDRYCRTLPVERELFTLRGPAFLLRQYAAALRRASYVVRLVIRAKAANARSVVALHFGDSYVVARAFEALENPVEIE